MESFKLWLEGNNIRYLGSGRYAGSAWVKFSVDGKVYEYAVDPLFLEPYSFYGRKFAAFIKHAPGRAFNLAKKQGTLISKPKPKPEPPEQKPQQGYLF
tara:strand:+ start:6563 stop:6856 length:294 start_codon:yes stop_codon:yes gene_type:complete